MKFFHVVMVAASTAIALSQYVKAATTVVAAPDVTVVPAVTPPTTQVNIAGSGFEAFEAVDLYSTPPTYNSWPQTAMAILQTKPLPCLRLRCLAATGSLPLVAEAA